MQIGGQRPEYGFDSWPPARALPTEGLATETRIERPMHPLPRVRDQIGKRNLRLVSLGLWLRSVLDRSDVNRVVATIAGDDTVFVLAREPLNGKELGEYFFQLAHS